MVEDLETFKLSSFLCNGRVSFELIMRESKYSHRKNTNKDPNSSLRKVLILEIKAFVNVYQLIRRKRGIFFVSRFLLLYDKRSLRQLQGIKQTKMICRSLLKSKVLEVGSLKALTSHLLLRKHHVWKLECTRRNETYLLFGFLIYLSGNWMVVCYTTLCDFSMYVGMLNQGSTTFLFQRYFSHSLFSDISDN